MVVPLKLGRNVVGCLEVANKRGTQEFTDNDQDLLKMVSEKVAAGLISFALRSESVAVLRLFVLKYSMPI